MREAASLVFIYNYPGHKEGKKTTNKEYGGVGGWVELPPC